MYIFFLYVMILIAEFAYISSQMSLSFYADKSLKLLPISFFSKSFPVSVFNILVEEILFFFLSWLSY